MPELSTDTLTFLFTDLEGTSLWERRPKARCEAPARHDATLREASEPQASHA